MTDKEIVKTFKKPLIWVSIISILVIVLMAYNINSLNNRLDNVYDTFEYSCSDGTYRVCIEDGKNYVEYPKGEYAIAIKNDETYVVCDTDRKERAVCIDEDKPWVQCQTNEFAYCIKEGSDWTTCSVGEDAKCIKEDKYSTISSNGYVNYCEIGEYSTCLS